MKRFRMICLVFVILSLMLSGCDFGSTPPDIDTVEQGLQEHYSDIEVVVNFLANSEYEKIIITDCSGKMLVGSETVKISDKEVVAALSNLLPLNYYLLIVINTPYRKISKNGNTIKFHQWSGSSDISCGIAYSIDGVHLPEIQYMTELYPMSVENWYYYVRDFNKWRLENRQ